MPLLGRFTLGIGTVASSRYSEWGCPESESRQGQVIFVFYETLGPDPGPTQPPIRWVTEVKVAGA